MILITFTLPINYYILDLIHLELGFNLTSNYL